MALLRYKAERSSHLPAGAVNKAHVYDFEGGQVARRDDGRLAYFPTLAAARRWAEVENDRHKRQVTLEPRMRLMAAAGRASSCRDARDSDGAAYWQAEADAARIELCVALGEPERADYWRRYYAETYGQPAEETCV